MCLSMCVCVLLVWSHSFPPEKLERYTLFISEYIWWYCISFVWLDEWIVTFKCCACRPTIAHSNRNQLNENQSHTSNWLCAHILCEAHSSTIMYISSIEASKAASQHYALNWIYGARLSVAVALRHYWPVLNRWCIDSSPSNRNSHICSAWNALNHFEMHRLCCWNKSNLFYTSMRHPIEVFYSLCFTTLSFDSGPNCFRQT